MHTLTQVKLPLCQKTEKRYVAKASRIAPNEDKCSAPRFGRLTPGERTPNIRLSAVWLDSVAYVVVKRKIPVSTGNRNLIVQPAARLCWLAIQAHQMNLITDISLAKIEDFVVRVAQTNLCCM
jgi:hypothetical protein